ncbi:MAG TPA: NAD(P)-dependent oxidoreductase [Candidatus Xenobia bacterium]|jgi:3-hydroxyisobutyrate dehydrogenase-like beta-hydroxyacid dehydrogenase
MRRESRRMNVGLIGLGNMGRGMATSLLRAGHALTVYNRTPGRTSDLAGAIIAGTPERASTGDVLITILSDDTAIESLLPHILPALSAQTIHVSMSTISVACCDRLAQAHRAAGRSFLSAPVWGRPPLAAAGQLMIIPAGAPADIERCRPVFEALGQRIHPVGDKPSLANVAKLSGNFLTAGIIEGLAEAFVLAQKSGIEPTTFLALLRATLFNIPMQATYADIIAHEKFEPAGFRAVLGLKDISLVQEAAAAVHVPMPLASLLHDNLMSAVASGRGDLDWTIVARLAAERAGLP